MVQIINKIKNTARKYMLEQCLSCQFKKTCKDFMNEDVYITRFMNTRCTCPKFRHICLQRKEQANGFNTI